MTANFDHIPFCENVKCYHKRSQWSHGISPKEDLDQRLCNPLNSMFASERTLTLCKDMSTVGHLSPGQWKNPKDRSTTKRKLDYWINLAKLLERGGINALFLADTYGGYDTYEASLDNCIRRASQWPMTDPTIVCARNAPTWIQRLTISSPYQPWQR
jgi:hypothetical protein